MYNTRKNKLIALALIGAITLAGFEVDEYNNKKLNETLNMANVVVHTSKTITQVDERLTKLSINHSIEGNSIHLYKNGKHIEIKAIGLEI